MKRGAPSLVFLLCLAQGCSVKLLDELNEDSLTNTCTVDADCGPGATCSPEHTCFSRQGMIDEVTLEIRPNPASSPYGGLSYLSAQANLSHGDSARNIPLPPTAKIEAGQVQSDAADLPAFPDCPYVGKDKVSIDARIEFTRISKVKGVPILGIPSEPLQVVTEQRTKGDPTSGWIFGVSLVPGTYEVYIQPANSPTCSIAPRVLKDVEIAPGPTVDPRVPPTTLDLGTPIKLSGTVQRLGGTLVGWEVSVVDPEKGRTISTTARLGDTNAAQISTNFEIVYQPVTSAAPSDGTAKPSALSPPFIQITPPKDMPAPTVLWDLSGADIDGDGHVSLDMSAIADEHHLVQVSGHVLGEAGAGFPATVRFFSSKLEGSKGLVATYFQAAKAGADGLFEAWLFPGDYRVTAIPDPPPGVDMSAPYEPAGGGTAASPWAITEAAWTIGKDGTQSRDLTLYRKRRVQGMGSAAGSEPAIGATLEASPSLIADQLTVLRGALAQTPLLPPNASSSLTADGTFGLWLDPGTFDMSLRSPASSNYAWWVSVTRPIAQSPAEEPIVLENVRLAIPVPLEGQMSEPSGLPLRNAVVRAYAQVPGGTSVAQVGETRTDEMGHYRLGLPIDFAR
jgi:hypothetical protein